MEPTIFSQIKAMFRSLSGVLKKQREDTDKKFSNQDAKIQQKLKQVKDQIDETLSSKMDTYNPSGTGAFAMNLGGLGQGAYSFSAGFGGAPVGNASVAIGMLNITYGDNSIALGTKNKVYSDSAAAIGRELEVYGWDSFVCGHNNIRATENKYVFVVGNGTNSDARSNAHTLDWAGNAWYAGTVEGTGMIVKSSTPGSTKRFLLAVDDSGAITAIEIV